MTNKNIRPEQLEEEIRKLLTDFNRFIADESQKSIIQNTPSRSGALRASIVANLNEPRGAYSPANTDPSGESTISSNSQVINTAELGTTINIATNAPYALDVEQGTAGRPPAGMFAQAAASLSAIARRFKK